MLLRLYSHQSWYRKVGDKDPLDTLHFLFAHQPGMEEQQGQPDIALKPTFDFAIQPFCYITDVEFERGYLGCNIPSIALWR